MAAGFTKRIYTFGTLLQDIGFILANAPRMAAISRSGAISRMFMEKIMTVVTAINGCVYCSWFHAKQAVESGLSEDEVHNLFNLQFETDASEHELPALIYAQHYAETNRHPDAAMTDKLFATYGDETARQILLIIRMIFFGNLAGNTWDAIVSRLKGKPAKGSSIVFEAVFFLLTWYVMLPLSFLVRDYRNKTAAAAGGTRGA